ncbi:MAG: chromophore lyase CpcT/CpeT [Candidatus Kapaibacteriota bacterium]|jgi:CpeT protein
MKILSVVLFLIPFASALAAHTERDPDFDSLVVWMEGSFSSAQQAAADSQYYHVDLHMARIWRDRTDGAWFYVEQAMGSTPEAPYRQRVYHVQRIEEGMLESIVYELRTPSAVVGAWKEPSQFNNITPEQLVLRRGCEVYLQATGESFVGGTHGTACRSDLRGASYASSQVTIMADRIVSWDRGFNAADEQVWGARSGGYVFLRTGK